MSLEKVGSYLDGLDRPSLIQLARKADWPKTVDDFARVSESHLRKKIFEGCSKWAEYLKKVEGLMEEEADGFLDEAPEYVGADEGEKGKLPRRIHSRHHVRSFVSSSLEGDREEHSSSFEASDYDSESLEGEVSRIKNSSFSRSNTEIRPTPVAAFSPRTSTLSSTQLSSLISPRVRSEVSLGWDQGSTPRRHSTMALRQPGEKHETDTKQPKEKSDTLKDAEDLQAIYRGKDFICKKCGKEWTWQKRDRDKWFHTHLMEDNDVFGFLYAISLKDLKKNIPASCTRNCDQKFCLATKE